MVGGGAKLAAGPSEADRDVVRTLGCRASCVCDNGTSRACIGDADESVSIARPRSARPARVTAALFHDFTFTRSRGAATAMVPALRATAAGRDEVRLGGIVFAFTLAKV